MKGNHRVLYFSISEGAWVLGEHGIFLGVTRSDILRRAVN